MELWTQNGNAEGCKSLHYTPALFLLPTNPCTHTFHLLYPHIDHTLWTRTLLAHLFQPHLQTPPHLTPNVLTTLSCSDSISVSCRGNVSLRCFLITGTMRWNAATQPPYQQHNAQKPTQCHTSAHKLVIRLIQLIQLKLLPQCCLIGIHRRIQFYFVRLSMCLPQNEALNPASGKL